MRVTNGKIKSKRKLRATGAKSKGLNQNEKLLAQNENGLSHSSNDELPLQNLYDLNENYELLA